MNLICTACGRDNGPASAVRKTRFGYVSEPCLCGHTIFHLRSPEERAEDERKAARADPRQISLFTEGEKP